MTSRVLIVYEKFGMGHFRMASIIKEILHNKNAEFIMLAGSDLLGTSDIKIFVSMWNYFMKKNWIRAADIIINYLSRIILVLIGEITHSRHFLERIEQIKPDIIICCADLFNRALGNYAKNNNIPFYIFITDISVFYDLIHPEATHICYFEETANAVRNFDFNRIYYQSKVDEDSAWAARMGFLFGNYGEFLLKGIGSSLFRNPDRHYPEKNLAKYFCIGALAEEKHFAEKDASYLKLKYGVPSDLDTILLASGSMGGQLLQGVINLLDKQAGRPLNVLVMCGHDKELYTKLTNSRFHNHQVNVMPFTFTPDFDEFLEMADCAVIRPSAGIFIECLIKKTPVITFKLAASNDRGSLAIIDKYQVGKVCSHYRDLYQNINIILDNQKQYRNNIEKLLAAYPHDWEEKSTALRNLIMG